MKSACGKKKKVPASLLNRRKTQVVGGVALGSRTCKLS